MRHVAALIVGLIAMAPARLAERVELAHFLVSSIVAVFVAACLPDDWR